ncbi:MAG: hypothetical protein J3T61_00215 [Candidatus Brocadiales bacterium]|nr:hypothetical protein [Candidatus Bathyanammoxibius sp.]
MTTFTGPFNVTQADSNTTVVSVDSSGTCTFAENITFTNPVTFAAAVEASGAFTFHAQNFGPGGVGLTELLQRATILQNNTAGNPVNISLPSGADVIDFWVDIETPFGTAAGVTACDIQASIAAAQSALAIVNVSASSRYDFLDADKADVKDLAQFRDITATIEVHASIQNSATAITTGQGVLHVRYVL